MKFKNLQFLSSFLFLLVIATGTFGQTKPYWQNLDFAKDSVVGVSVERAYGELLKGKKSKTVIVAVLDGGVDIQHEDLKRVVYKNDKETLNGKDDDKNGYVDDLNGWNFLGNGKQDIDFETLELVRQLKKLKLEFAKSNVDSLITANDQKYNAFLLMKTDYAKQYETARRDFSGVAGFKNTLELMESKMNKDSLTIEGFKAYDTTGPAEKFVRKAVIDALEDTKKSYATFKEQEINKPYDYFYEKVNYHLNLDFDPREELGIKDETPFYGNNNVAGPDALHGTHVAGIIAADRENNLGINGIANNVKILGVRMVPNGDERDVDVANAIRYAVDQGAKVINMSFGKSYSENKKIVDDAVKYAVANDVLLVHAAGNDNKNLDIATNFPNRTYADSSGIASSWLEIGASGPKKDGNLKASFSNYGKTTVDVFAPGVEINSTAPGSTYQSLSGTSMASPVVSGIAALIRSYYPSLTATQVKQIIMDSSVKIDQSVNLTADKKKDKVPFSSLSISGGVANAYLALKMAHDLAKGRVVN